MVYDPDRHHRHSIRLPNHLYDLSGRYCVTICTSQKQEILGQVRKGVMELNHIGNIVASEWEDLPQRFPTILLDAFVVMPNHLHGILMISPPSDCAAPTLGAIIGAFKSLSVRAVSLKIGEEGCKIWQRRYYDQIIRSDSMLENLRCYIRENPAHWPIDPENSPL